MVHQLARCRYNKRTVYPTTEAMRCVHNRKAMSYVPPTHLPSPKSPPISPTKKTAPSALGAAAGSAASPMTDNSRDDTGEPAGWSPTRTLQTARRGTTSSSAVSVKRKTTTDRSRCLSHDGQKKPHGESEERTRTSKTFGIMVLLGIAGLYLWRLFNLWALQWAMGVDLPAAMYRVLAGILIANFAAYKLLRNLVSHRKKVAGTVRRGLGWVSPLPRAAGVIITCVALRIVERVFVYATASVTVLISGITGGIRRMVYIVLRRVGRIVGFAAGLFKAKISNMRNGIRRATCVVLRAAEVIGVMAVNFLRKKMSLICIGAKLTGCAMLRAMGRVVQYTAGSLTTALSTATKGVMRSIYTVRRSVETVIEYGIALPKTVISNAREGARRAIRVLPRTPRRVVVRAANLATTSLCQTWAARRRRAVRTPLQFSNRFWSIPSNTRKSYLRKNFCTSQNAFFFTSC